MDKHWSYGVFGVLVDARGNRPLLVVAPVQTDRTTDSMVEIAGEFRAIVGDRPIAGEEFASLKRNMELRLPGRFETLASLEGAAQDLVNYGYSPAFYYDYAKTVRSLGEGDLAGAVKRVVSPDQLIWVVVGDLEKIEADVRALGYGEVVRLDSAGSAGE
jgi:zinc protease